MAAIKLEQGTKVKYVFTREGPEYIGTICGVLGEQPELGIHYVVSFEPIPDYPYTHTSIFSTNIVAVLDSTAEITALKQRIEALERLMGGAEK